MEHSLTLDQLTPRGSASTIAFDYLEDTFGAGNAFPYSLVIEPPDGASLTIQCSALQPLMQHNEILGFALQTGDARGIMSEQFFVETSAVLEKIVNGFNRPDGTVLGVPFSCLHHDPIISTSKDMMRRML